MGEKSGYFSRLLKAVKSWPSPKDSNLSFGLPYAALSSSICAAPRAPPAFDKAAASYLVLRFYLEISSEAIPKEKPPRQRPAERGYHTNPQPEQASSDWDSCSRYSRLILVHKILRPATNLHAAPRSLTRCLVFFRFLISQQKLKKIKKICPPTLLRLNCNREVKCCHSH